jgi:predicted NUDIX family NTP pyrophosphohydrolase
MANRSAGILPFRTNAGALEVLLAHPGGPFWRNRDDGAWSIVKGEYLDGEDAETAARREFTEETGWEPAGDLLPLGEVRQPGGKYVIAFAVEGDFDPATLRSEMFEIEWPPRSGAMRSFPEVDRAAWFDLDTARRKILAGQAPFLARFEAARGR